MTKLDLGALDVDGAIRESAEEIGIDRSSFLKKGAVTGAGLLAGSALFAQYVDPAQAAISTRRKSRANDVKILNFALTLEYLEAEFYAQARSRNSAYGDNDALANFGRIVATHEANHVSFLRRALGSKRIGKPRFDFGDTVTDPAKFAATSQVLEDTGVTAYLGQVANISQDSVLAAAGTIATVEARHAAWIRFINGGGASSSPLKAAPAPLTFDERRSERSILKAVGDTGFIEG